MLAIKTKSICTYTRDFDKRILPQFIVYNFEHQHVYDSEFIRYVPKRIGIEETDRFTKNGSKFQLFGIYNGKRKFITGLYKINNKDSTVLFGDLNIMPKGIKSLLIIDFGNSKKIVIGFFCGYYPEGNRVKTVLELSENLKKYQMEL